MNISQVKTWLVSNIDNVTNMPSKENGAQEGDIDTRDRLIPDEVMHDVTVFVSIVCPIIISLFGTLTNILNLIIFLKLGLKEGITIGLWALSFSDLMVTFQTLGSSLCYLANILVPGSTIDPILIQFVSLCWSQDMFYLISNWITTYISIERSVCVVLPFKVKRIFTRGRYIFAMVAIYAFHIISYLPIFATHWLSVEPQGLLSSNSSEPERWVMVVHYSPDRVTIHHTVDIIEGAVLPVIQQSLVTISAIYLAYGLKQSSKIRKSLVESQGDMKKSMLSSKESRLISVVILLAVISTICNLPRFIAVYATLLIPEMAIGELYENVYVFLWALTAMFASFNASVNIFVYLLVNVSFRKKCVSTLCPCMSKTVDEQVSSSRSF